MTTTDPTPRATAHATPRRPRRLAALAKSEYLQFRRNTTLMVMGVGFPVAFPLLPFIISLRDDDVTTNTVATTFETFAMLALLFVQYYAVLSMITTRRSEGVLKRLRTGEAKDWQIQAAPIVPGALLTLAGTALISVIVYGTGSPAPVNAAAIVVAIVLGTVLFSLLALATSGLTKNAEAAQITSLPIMALTIVGIAPIRSLLPDNLGSIADWTPFAALSDLISLGAEGRLATAPSSTAALDLAGTFSEMALPAAIVVGWSALAWIVTRMTFRWDDRS